MRVTVSSAKSLRLAKGTNKKIPVAAGAVTGRSCRAPFFFALPFFTRGRTCWAVLERLVRYRSLRDSCGIRPQGNQSACASQAAASGSHSDNHRCIFAQFLTLLRKNPGKKIFVHSRLGDDRTGMMIASYRMAQEGWSAEKAEKEMEKFGFSFTHRRLICPGLSRKLPGARKLHRIK